MRRADARGLGQIQRFQKAASASRGQKVPREGRCSRPRWTRRSIRQVLLSLMENASACTARKHDGAAAERGGSIGGCTCFTVATAQLGIRARRLATLFGSSLSGEEAAAFDMKRKTWAWESFRLPDAMRSKAHGGGITAENRPEGGALRFRYRRSKGRRETERSDKGGPIVEDESRSTSGNFMS